MTPQSFLHGTRGQMTDGNPLRNRRMEQFFTNSGNPMLPIFNTPQYAPNNGRYLQMDGRGPMVNKPQVVPQQAPPPVGGPMYGGNYTLQAPVMPTKPMPVGNDQFAAMQQAMNMRPQYDQWGAMMQAMQGMPQGDPRQVQQRTYTPGAALPQRQGVPLPEFGGVIPRPFRPWA